MGKISIVDQVVDYITKELIEGQLAPGERIPTENELCEQLGVTRNSVREAIKKLQAYGVVHIKRAEGTFISDRYNQKMLDPILYDIILQKNCWSDFVQMRKVIDIGTLHVVVNQARQADLEELKRTLAAMKDAFAQEAPSVQTIMELDTYFHDIITQATGNPQLASIAEYITRLTVPSRIRTIRKVVDQGDGEPFIALHKQLLDIIENKRAGDIDQAVEDHYVYWQ